MIAIPAIDLRDGACVQLVGGSFEQERVRLRDPVAVAMRWRDAGFTRLHVIDLDAATGRGSNAAVVSALVATNGLSYQVGGGIRDATAVERWLTRGASTVVVGTRGVEDPGWLAEQARRHPGRIVLALDVRGGRVQVRGWTADVSASLSDVLRRLEGAPLAGVLVTAVDVEGRMTGPDLPLMRQARAATTLPLVASGGIASLDDLTALESARVDAAVIGMALYTGGLDAVAVARRFGA
jgi:phosphoribosylformimino-5-aminoimidazole carboxamide ribotide isomerase